MLQSFDFSITQWVLVFMGAVIIGAAKAGIKGIDILNITIMALVFGSKASTGVILPMLCFADVMAVFYYKRNVQWKHFWRLIPPMIVGLVLAMWFGKDINEASFKQFMVIIIVSSLALMIISESKKNVSYPNSLYFSTFMGLISGITTMLGNLAGAFSNIYFLSLKINKAEFIGTAAWVFLVINLIKLPLQIFVWKNIDTNTFSLNLVLLPALALGFFLGIKILNKINEKLFRQLIIGLTVAGAILILIK